MEIPPIPQKNARSIFFPFPPLLHSNPQYKSPMKPKNKPKETWHEHVQRLESSRPKSLLNVKGVRLESNIYTLRKVIA